MYSEELKALLLESGWYPNRKIWVRRWIWVKKLKAEGFRFHTEALKVLKEFGGLEIPAQRNEAGKCVTEVMQFDPCFALGFFDTIDLWQNFLNACLTPIARIGGGSILLLADDRRVFLCRDDMLWLEGETFEQALENQYTLQIKNTEFAQMTQ